MAKFLVVLGLALVLNFLCIIIYYTVQEVNSLITLKLDGYATLVDKKFVPEHIETYKLSTANGKIFTQKPQQQIVSDDWVLTFNIENREVSFSVLQEIFDLVEIDSVYFIEYSTGMFDKNRCVVRSYN